LIGGTIFIQRPFQLSNPFLTRRWNPNNLSAQTQGIQRIL